MHDSEPIGKLFTYVALLANKDEEHPEYVTHTPSEMCQNFLGAWVGVIMIGYVFQCAEQCARITLTCY